MVGFVVWNLGAYKYATAQSEQSALNAWEWASCGVLFKIYQWAYREPSTF